jgi:uncharacterized metal-binding protein YceD (DUF177 family)
VKISFSKIKQTPIDIDYSKNGVDIQGTLERVDRDSVKLDSTFKSEVEVVCNRCAKEYKIDANYPLSLILSDGGYNGKDEIDVVEFYEGKIDFDYLALSEVSSIQEDYNYCSSCQDSDEVLEVEF